MVLGHFFTYFLGPGKPQKYFKEWTHGLGGFGPLFGILLGPGKLQLGLELGSLRP